MRTLDDLRAAPDGAVVSARVRVTDIRVQQTFRRRVQVTTAFLADETGTAEATWFGRRFIERRMRAGDELIVSGKLKHRGVRDRVRRPGVPAGRRGEPAPRRPDRAGLPADAGPDRGAPAPGDARGARQGGLRVPGVPARPSCAPRRTCRRSPRRSSTPTTRRRSRRATRRSAGSRSTSCSRSSWAWSRGGGRAAGRARPAVVADDARDRAIRAALEASLARKLGHEAALTRRPGDARSTRSAATSRGPCRCSGSSRATSARARPRSRRGRSRRPRSRGGRGRCSRRPTSSPASTRRPSATCVEDLGRAGDAADGLAHRRRRAGRRCEAIATGQAGIVVGTHALFQEAVAFADLALAVVDEQHRFGVEQRGALEAKATRGAPHVLLMTATPIPRTLGQVLYADLDVSTLRSAPAGPRPDPDRDPPARRARGHVGQGPRGGRRRAGARSSSCRGSGRRRRRTRTTARTRTTGSSTTTSCSTRTSRPRGPPPPRPSTSGSATLLAPLRVGSSTGASSRPTATARWPASATATWTCSSGTTVVEVGVDVPEATMMVVEGAERFGLAQLHQLRGRVGRGTDPSRSASSCRDGGGGHDRARAAQGRRLDDRRLRARRARLRAAPRGRRPGPRPERPAAPARRDARQRRRTASWRPAPASTRSG